MYAGIPPEPAGYLIAKLMGIVTVRRNWKTVTCKTHFLVGDINGVGWPGVDGNVAAKLYR